MTLKFLAVQNLYFELSTSLELAQFLISYPEVRFKPRVSQKEEYQEAISSRGIKSKSVIKYQSRKYFLWQISNSNILILPKGETVKISFGNLALNNFDSCLSGNLFTQKNKIIIKSYCAYIFQVCQKFFDFFQGIWNFYKDFLNYEFVINLLYKAYFKGKKLC